MLRWAAGLLFLLSGAVQAHELLDRLDGCIQRLDPQLDVGYERIAARCPELVPALTQSPWSAWLPADWSHPHNQLTADGLSELRTLLARAMSPQVTGRPMRTERVAALLTRIAQPDEDRSGWWQKFKAWLRQIMGVPEAPEREPAWLRKLDLSGGVIKVLGWSLLGIVVAMAAGILLNELRVAGLLRRRVAARRDRRGPARNVPLSLASVDATAPQEQPALLLELITQCLTDQGLLPPARALTTRELLNRVRLPADSQRAELEELARTSEQLRYSPRELAVDRLAAVIASGRRVLAQLEGAGAETVHA
ncbi:MAG: DUF4129 domain-containing protein [Proteobacteria bacterium]|nr:DUF4129 domain-containing protein [Pseudomonadota bacterium]